MDTNKLNTWLPQLLQISDTMFPTGSYAHSYGLEGFVQDEMIKNNTDFQNFIYDIVIPSLENFELQHLNKFGKSLKNFNKHRKNL